MKGERGFTLVELSIVVLLLGVLGLITTSVVINAFHRQAEADGRAVAIASVRTGLQRVVRDLREADFPLLELTSSDVIFTVTTGATTTTICYNVTTTAGVTSLTRSVGGCGSSQRTTEATNLSSTSVFSVPYAAYGYKPPSGVNGFCAISGYTPPRYDVRCPGAVMVELNVIPKNASTGATLCPAGTTPAQCDIDVSDTAELRNTP